ncbi:MAG: hypothetical protein ACXWZ0_18880 [Mycobacterium sp.]
MAAGISAAIVIAVVTGIFAVRDSEESAPSEGDAAQQRCEVDVVNRLASPSTAQISEIEAKSDVLDADSRDLFSLLEPPLKGVDHSRIKVWNVAGVVNSQNDFGDTMQTPFTCRAYFLDGNLAHALVLLDHDH